MDNVTHTLVRADAGAYAAGRAGRGTTAALILASNAPDIDIVAAAGGALKYLNGIAARPTARWASSDSAWSPRVWCGSAPRWIAADGAEPPPTSIGLRFVRACLSAVSIVGVSATC